MEYLYTAVVFSIRDGVHDGGAQRNEADASGNKHEVAAAILFHGEAVAVGSANGKLIPGLERMKGRGTTANLPDGKERFALGGARRERSGKLARAKQ